MNHPPDLFVLKKRQLRKEKNDRRSEQKIEFQATR